MVLLGLCGVEDFLGYSGNAWRSVRPYLVVHWDFRAIFGNAQRTVVLRIKLGFASCKARPCISGL